jgi:ATP-binding cassette, subfamily B, bacterial PglK
MLKKNKFKSIAQVLTLFEGKEKTKLFLLLISMFFMGLLEVLGVVSIAPFMAVVSNPEIIHQNYYLSYIYKYFSFESQNNFLLALGMLAIFVVIFSNFFSAIINWKIITISRMQTHLVSLRLLKKYLSQPYLFYLNQNTSSLSKNILSEVDRTLNGVVLPGLLALSRSAIAIFIIFFLFYLNALVALISIMVLGSMYLLIFQTFKKRLKSYGEAASAFDSERYKAATEAMSGIKAVKLHSKEEVFLRRFEIPSEGRARYTAFSQLTSILPRYLLDTVAFGAILSIMTIMVFLGKSSVQIIPFVTVFAFAGYRLMPALQQIYASSTQLKFNFPALNILVNDLMIDNERPIKDIDDQNKLTFSKELILENITYKYPNTLESIVKKININIAPNTTVGFVGQTGSGKTTLIDIILGLLKPISGKLLLDGVELSNDNISFWQQNIGYVPQDIYIIDDTIEKNIAFGEANIDKGKIRNAAVISEMEEFINSLSNGYQTIIGERGVRLSGGQRQRIGIARAIYNDPDVIVFDEATSSLDGDTENQIMQAIANLSNKKTIIMIAHRFTTLKNCDVIYLIDKGEVVNSGKYFELLESSSDFKSMANL